MNNQGIDWLIPIGPNECKEYVDECLRSVYSQVSILEDSLVIVCEKTQWEKYVKPPIGLECQVIQPPIKKNASAYRNKGLQFIKRPFVIFQDSDDISMQYRREEVAEALSYSDLVCSGYYIIDEKGLGIGQRKLKGSDDAFFFRNNAPLPTLAIRSRLLKTIRFNEDLPMGEDNELIGRLIEQKVKIRRLTMPLIKYRVIKSKHGYRSGRTGIVNELRYRFAMLKYANVKQSILLTFGALICIVVKSLPRTLFDSLHRRSHGG